MTLNEGAPWQEFGGAIDLGNTVYALAKTSDMIYAATGHIYGNIYKCALVRPVIENISFDPCISELCTSAISVTAHDPAGGTLTYDWQALNGGTIVGSGANVGFEPPDSGPHPCPYNVKVTVTSSVSGLSAEKTIGIYVKLVGDADGDGVVRTR